MKKRLDLETATQLGSDYWRYQAWKDKLPYNLRIETDDYDLYGAYRSGAEAKLEKDGKYHLPSRDPRTGRILKRPNHPTFRQALEEDHKLGYEPVWRNGEVYTVKRNQKGKGGKLDLETVSEIWNRPRYEWDNVVNRPKAEEGKGVNGAAPP